MLRNDDTRLAHELERKLGQMPGVNLFNLKVGVQNGRALLSGIVASPEEKQAALSAAAGIEGVTSVDDAIAVETPRTGGAGESDGQGPVGPG
ncbi:MAG TPA: BON domain-containing protein [Armatimonadota bacterium]|nr:BON domain-containing protein [Armatimonadota bacterium]